jgi:hypothetical protein
MRSFYCGVEIRISPQPPSGRLRTGTEDTERRRL